MGDYQNLNTWRNFSFYQIRFLKEFLNGFQKGVGGVKAKLKKKKTETDLFKKAPHSINRYLPKRVPPSFPQHVMKSQYPLQDILAVLLHKINFFLFSKLEESSLVHVGFLTAQFLQKS